MAKHAETNSCCKNCAVILEIVKVMSPTRLVEDEKRPVEKSIFLLAKLMKSLLPASKLFCHTLPNVPKVKPSWGQSSFKFAVIQRLKYAGLKPLPVSFYQLHFSHRPPYSWKT